MDRETIGELLQHPHQVDIADGQVAANGRSALHSSSMQPLWS
jgi:hypothetical protein